MELPRIAVVFRFWQCDNENQAGVKGRCDRSRQGSDLLAALHPPKMPVSNEKKKPAASIIGVPPVCIHWPVNMRDPESIIC